MLRRHFRYSYYDVSIMNLFHVSEDLGEATTADVLFLFIINDRRLSIACPTTLSHKSKAMPDYIRVLTPKCLTGRAVSKGQVMFFKHGGLHVFAMDVQSK